MAWSDSSGGLRRRAAVQMAYVALFALFVLWPNLRANPSLIIVVATALASVWLVGGLAAWAKIPRADELLLCGSTAPLLVGLTQLAYRLNFLRTHGSLTRPGAETDSATAFVTIWAVEVLLILVPAAAFVWWNARGLLPLQPSRPESESKRT